MSAMHDSVLRVLTYHRVVDPADSSAARSAGVSATPADFDMQMRHLARRYRVLSADEVLAARRAERPLPARAVLVTFDDGYRDFGDVAWPILRRYRLPVTAFVPTAYPDRPDLEFWWDRLDRVFRLTSSMVLEVPPLGRLRLDTHESRAEALRNVEAHLKEIPHTDAMRMVEQICAQLGDAGAPAARVLGWSELRELANDGVTLAPHTRTHPALSRLPAEEARAEIRGSRDDLRREIGETLPIFAYPFGAHDDGVVRLMREEGFELALTCIDGHNRLASTDPLRLRRTNITRRTTPLVFRVRLHPIGAYVDRWRHRRERAAVATPLAGA
jgi:peptidoglycan/xylan/chitin deacetylase (PgdA/CDA1 family)